MDGTGLATIPVFADLDEDERERLAGVCSDLAVDAGTAEVSQDGVVIRTLGPGDVFGEIAVLSGGRRSATVTARTDMQLVTVLNRDVWRLERDSPDVGASLRQTIDDCLSR